MPFLTAHHLLLHAAVSASVALLSTLLDVPARVLHGLHTYIHPDSIPSSSSSDGLRAAIRGPNALPPDPKRRSRSKDFDESKAQLLRLRLADAHLHSRLFFPLYRAAFLSSSVALSNLALRTYSSSIPVLAAMASAAYLSFALAKLGFERSATRQSERQLSVLSGFLAFLSALLVVFPFSPSVFDFRLGGGTDAGLLAAALAGCLAAMLFIPAARAARSFWLGTDQLRWNLPVISCGPLAGILLYLSLLASISVPLLWINPMAAVMPVKKEFRIWALAATAASQLLVLRANVQMYLNEAVLCWYQRLHASRVPDMDYGRAKVFLHNHYLCLVVLQFLAPPLIVLLLLGISQMRGNLLSGLLFLSSLEAYSDVVKEMGLFLAWWATFVWSILTMSSIVLYRCGILFIS